MSEPVKDELLVAKENKEEGDKEEKKLGQFTPISLTLMVVFVVGLIGVGCWYTYYQYNRMEQINSAK